MAMKHGYTSVEEYKAGVQKKFSLLETGIIQKPSTRLLLINVSVRGLFSVSRFFFPLLPLLFCYYHRVTTGHCSAW